jgi:hypothetical protein
MTLPDSDLCQLKEVQSITLRSSPCQKYILQPCDILAYSIKWFTKRLEETRGRLSGNSGRVARGSRHAKTSRNQWIMGCLGTPDAFTGRQLYRQLDHGKLHSAHKTDIWALSLSGPSLTLSPAIHRHVRTRTLKHAVTSICGTLFQYLWSTRRDVVNSNLRTSVIDTKSALISAPRNPTQHHPASRLIDILCVSAASLSPGGSFPDPHTRQTIMDMV